MLNAFFKGKMDDLMEFEEVKTSLLEEYGTPSEWLWLIDLDITNDDKGIIFLHESGEMLQHAFFELDDMETFIEACKFISAYFN